MNNFPDSETQCPECGITWIGDEIPEEHRELYGDKQHFMANIMGVEYGYPSPEQYDGISEWKCTGCGTRWGRWTHKILGEGELEPVYGG